MLDRKLQGMNLTWTYAILSLLVFANAFSEDELVTFISLTKYAYEDACAKTADVEWNFINKPTNRTRRLWETAAIEYAQHKIKQMNETDALPVEPFHNRSLEYSYNTVIKPGDSLLEADDFNELISFIGQAEISRLTGYYLTGTKKHFRQDVERQLGCSVKSQDKLAAWTAWHQTLAPLAANFSKNLPLVQKAAIANGKNDVSEYWEMLCDANNGYDQAKDMWNKMSFLYAKLLKYVKNRLATKYHIDNDTLPAHLLGSLPGYDWTNIAMDVVPFSDITYSIRKNLWEKELVGEALYKKASGLGHTVFKHVPQADFWSESEFRGQCPSHLVNLCREGKMRISTCNEASISNFISAHKNVAKILVSQMSHETDPILKVANRYSPLDEAVAELFGILSVSHAWLNTRGLINNDTDLDNVRTVSLMITALDVLPRMAYYLAADTWRIDAIRNESLSSDDLASAWWKYRTEYEGVNTSVPNLPTFLDDDYITSNRPYLAKFLGTVLGFQIYEYLMDSTEVRYDTLVASPSNRHVSKMIRLGYAGNWSEMIKEYLEFEELDVDILLSYFSPLDEYLEEVEELNEKVSIPLEQERELDVLQDTYRKIFNAPPTTTTTTTTTTTSTAKPIRAKPSGSAARIEPSKSSVSEGSSVTTNATSAKTIEVPPANKTKETPVHTESVQPESTTNGDAKPKANTSKAVWAVAAVLIATVTICIIAIFGRRRCRKAPKNRRYV